MEELSNFIETFVKMSQEKLSRKHAKLIEISSVKE